MKLSYWYVFSVGMDCANTLFEFETLINFPMFFFPLNETFSSSYSNVKLCFQIESKIWGFFIEIFISRFSFIKLTVCSSSWDLFVKYFTRFNFLVTVRLNSWGKQLWNCILNIKCHIALLVTSINPSLYRVESNLFSSIIDTWFFCFILSPSLTKRMLKPFPEGVPFHVLPSLLLD